jgi:hemin uptake protein HemP
MQFEEKLLSHFKPYNLFNTSNVRRMRSTDLLKNEREMVIVHDDKEYRLIHTHNNQLLLV